MRRTRRSELKKRPRPKQNEKSFKLVKDNVRRPLRTLPLKLLGTISSRRKFVMKKKLRPTLEIESLRERWQIEKLL